MLEIDISIKFIYQQNYQYTMVNREVWLQLSSGLGRGYPDSYFDPQQLATGTKIEMEHTSNQKIAKEIAKDHLVEFPDYYTYLLEMEYRLKNRECIRKVFGW
jgi:hypothetical protein